MAKNNKDGAENKTAPKTTIKVVTLNPKSGYFFDPTSRLKLTPGLEINVTPEMLASKRFMMALSNGHIVISNKEAVIEQLPQTTTVNTTDNGNYDKALKVYEESTSDNIIENFKKAFDLETLKKMAVEDFKIETKKMSEDELIDEIISKIDDIVLENEN